MSKLKTKSEMIQFFLQARLFFSHSLCKPKNQPPAFLNLLDTPTMLFNSKFVSAQKNLPCQCLTVPAASKSTQRWGLKTTHVLSYISGGQKSKNTLQGCLHLEAPGENRSPCHSRILRGTDTLRLVVPSSIFEAAL